MANEPKVAEIGIDLADQRKDRATSPNSKVEQLLAETLRETDPRDYFRKTTFQKHARAIDNDPTHPWETEPDSYMWASDPGSEVTVATVHDPGQKRTGLLIATKIDGQEPVTAYLTQLEPSVRDVVSDVTSIVARRFTMAAKPKFVNQIVNEANTLASDTPDVAAAKIVSTAVSLLSDYPTATRFDRQIELPRVDFGIPAATADKHQLLQNFFELLSTKMPPDRFQASIAEFTRNIPSTDHIYGKNFKYIFTDGLGWLIASRPDTKINESATERTQRAATFPVKDLVTKPLGSDDKLRTTLSEMLVKPEPDTRYAKHSPTRAEFVELDKLVGGPGITDWSIISQSEGRGFEKTREIARGFADGTVDVAGGGDSTIYVKEVNGEYFIGRDGRHRAAAMKALGVPFAPMMVSHVEI